MAGRRSIRRTKEKRIERTRRVIRKRLAEKDLHIFGYGPRFLKEPNRLNKTKIKFTGPRKSLKEDKQIANRKTRRVAKEAIKRDKDIPVEGKNSVRWDYW